MLSDWPEKWNHPPEVYLHDQDMVGEEVDGTSIPLNLAKSWTIGGGGRMAIKGRG